MIGNSPPHDTNLEVNVPCKYYDPDEFKNLKSKFSHNFSFFHLNVQGLSAKWDKLNLLLSDLNSSHGCLDFIGFSEAFHHENDNRLHLDGYHNLISKVRNNPSQRGGVAIFVKESFECTLRPDLSIFVPHIIESVLVECKLGRRKLIVGVIYRPNTPPLADVDVFSFHLYELLDKIDRERCQCIVMGDMNIDCMKSPFDTNISDFIDNIYARGFIPEITIPTRVTAQTATLIDHIYSNKFSENLTSGVIVTDVSDHYAIFFIDNTRHPQPETEQFHRSYSDRNITCFIDTLNRMDFTNITNETDCQKAYNILHYKLSFAHTLSFPEKKLHQRFHKHSPWITSGITQSCKTKHKLLKKNQTITNRTKHSKLQELQQQFKPTHSCTKKKLLHSKTSRTSTQHQSNLETTPPSHRLKQQSKETAQITYCQ